MLRITLYKNCILNETYQNVISTAIKSGTSVLERYLATLNSHSIPDLDYVYYENNGELNFDLELVNGQDIYQYNYMKMQYYDEEGSLLLLRYCFIKDIKVNNEIVILTYTEDIFSSYSKEIRQIQESYLSKSRIVTYSNKSISPYKLPFKYDGNKVPKVSSLFNLTATSQYYLIAEIQLYDLTQEGEQTNRRIEYVRLRDTNNYSHVGMWESNIDDFLLKVVENMSSGKVKKSYKYLDPDTQQYVEVVLKNYSYEIGDVYLFPCILVNSDLNTYKEKYSSLWDIDYKFMTSNNVEFGDLTLITGVKNFSLKKTITIANNFKNMYVGTLDALTEMVNNGLSCDVEIYFGKNDYNIGLYMGFQNQLIDITESYKVDLPVEPLTSQALSQLKIARELKNKNLDYERRTTITNGLMDLWKRGNNVFKGFMVGGGYGALAAGIQESPGTTGTILNSSFKLQNIADTRKAVNADAYSSDNGVFGNSTNIFNQHNGLFIVEMDSVNDNYVKKAINNFGYETFEFISNLSEIDFNNVSFYTTNNINYNSIKFETINVIGNFTSDIAQQLNEIFISGVKIWYNENLQDDNLVVG